MKHKTLTSLSVTLLLMASAGIRVQAQNAISYTTAGDRSISLEKQMHTLEPGNGTGGYYIRLYPKYAQQTMDGFGFALTYSTCYNLLHMSQEERTAFLKQTFSPTEGYGVSYARISIGCCDFSSKKYTLCDTKGLENFALQSDETEYIIPILKEILAINPDLKIMAAPWTPPRWMKSSNSWSGFGFLKVTLKSEYYQDYADYFVKFINAMKDNGIKIYAVSPQNEPLNKGNVAGCYMPWDQEADFVKVLAPTFKKNGIDTKIYVFDHNFNYDNASDQNDYPIQLYNKIGNDFEGAELVVGSAYHDYGGDPSEVQDIHNQAPEKEVIFTEASIGEWNEGRKLENRLTEDMNRLVIGLTNNYCRAILFWNLMLDTDKGPNMSGGCTTCYGAVDIDNSNYSTITYNRHYYEICHASSVIRPGAKRIRTSGNAPSNITNQAYQNPDGSFGILLVNTQNAATDVTLRDGTGNVKVTVPASGVVSVLINSESSGIDDVKADDTISQENSYYNLKGQLINGPLEHEVYIKNGQKLIK